MLIGSLLFVYDGANPEVNGHVYLIDFAHYYPATDGKLDEGYILGMEK